VLLTRPLTAADQRFTAERPVMGTLARITIYTESSSTAVRAFRAAFDLLDSLEAELSDYRPGSELNRLCRDAAAGPVVVSEDLYRVLEASATLAEETGGAFDVTAGPVSLLWREARRLGRVPDPAAIARARRLTGYGKITLDPATRSVRLASAGMRLDLGGIAKGYAAGRALASLRAADIERAMVVIGGDIATGAPPPDKPFWRIRVAAAEKGNHTVIDVRDCGVSTSGDRSQHLDLDGKRLSHIFDARTGAALSGAAAITVVAPSATQADGLATALSVIGPRRAAVLARRHSGVIVLATRPGKASEILLWRDLPNVRFVRSAH